MKEIKKGVDKGEHGISNEGKEKVNKIEVFLFRIKTKADRKRRR